MWDLVASLLADFNAESIPSTLHNMLSESSLHLWFAAGNDSRKRKLNDGGKRIKPESTISMRLKDI